eukprot:TRINITY_DN272_c0_g1_i1.p1 TRINITY_DN272_c0_g1~~TRINITY_DN272_c0_g1_i1.p1  ORF type:complete len:165 (+),score=2.84 TRINITY_DN272_c0_g1_i1:60-497(+)
MAEGHKSARGGTRAPVDPVAKNAIWDEVCRKEHKHYRLVEDYQLSMKNINVLPDKPNHCTPVAKPATPEEVHRIGELQATLARSMKAPAEKHTVPQTTSQELGFYKPPSFNRRFNFGIAQSEMSKYAEAVFSGPRPAPTSRAVKK